MTPDTHIETIRTVLVDHFWHGGYTPTLTATKIAEQFGLAGALNIGAIAQVIRDYRQEGFVKVAEEVYETISRLREAV